LRFRTFLLVAAVLLPGAVVAQDPPAAGEVLFDIGGCTSCHTAKNGERLAGGLALETPFGTFFTPNITPDPETGIGGWTLEEFTASMREGHAPGIGPLYPSFPYTSYTLMPDADIAALKAYLDTVDPVVQANRPHELHFPYSLRWGLHLWQALFFEPRRFEPDPAQSAAWNRGAYLVNGPGHCQECHTPRTWYGALDRSRAFTGTTLKPGPGEIPNITRDPEHGIGKWSAAELATVLSLGMLPDGDFVGDEMAKVVDHQTSKLPKEDLDAIVTYLMSLPGG
jgi:mono/diheme cytochrome c family protein